MSSAKIIFLVFLSGWGFEHTSAQIDYSRYNAILSENVSATGIVDYDSILKNDIKSLTLFLDQMAAAEPEKLNRKEQLAYWINTYNANTLKLIVDHWPVSSIKDIGDGNPWDEKWIEINGMTYSLDQIEHDIIRPQFEDPRIHFAVNCAAKSCPPLLNKPYTGAELDEMLDQQTRQFINNTLYNQLSNNSISISRIFEWYKEDFGDLIGFINNFSENTIEVTAVIRYNTYDWALNN